MTLGPKMVPLVLVLCAPALHAQPVVLDPHIRTTDPSLLESLTLGRTISSTFRQIADEIDRSDVIVYVVFERQPTAGVAAHVSFMTAAGGYRYVHVGIDQSLRRAALIGILAHELEHATEIARERSVVDAATLRSLYTRIGFAGDARGRAENFDSGAAIDAGHRAMREALEASATWSAIALRRRHDAAR